MQHYSRQKHAEWLAGVIASTIANRSARPPAEPMLPKDFPLMLLQETERKPPINRKRVAASWRDQLDRAASYKGRGRIRIKGGPE